MGRPLDMYVQFFFPDLSAHVFQVPYFSPPSTLSSLLDHSLLSTNHTCKHFGYLILFVQCNFCVSFFMANLEWILNWQVLKKILFFVLGSNPGFGWKICIKNCTVWTKLYKGFSRNLICTLAFGSAIDVWSVAGPTSTPVIRRSTEQLHLLESCGSFPGIPDTLIL